MIAYPRFYKNFEPYLENPVTKNYLTLALTLATLIVLILFAIQPTLTTIVTLQKTLSEQTDVELALNQKISALTKATETYKAINQDISLISNALPPDPSFKSYLSSIENLVSKNGVSLVGLDFKDLPLSSATTSAKLSQGTNFTAVVKGEYPKVKGFINSLENLPRITDIKEVSFSEEQGSGEVTANIKAKTYYFAN
ncbi:MAG: type 4a pilus biogenesis protein PilO [Patescibacteria group bacterium]|nr:type 4a pilus biogenesis protein PilO [Patescibacteria group bacterium]